MSKTICSWSSSDGSAFWTAPAASLLSYSSTRMQAACLSACGQPQEYVVHPSTPKSSTPPPHPHPHPHPTPTPTPGRWKWSNCRRVVRYIIRKLYFGQDDWRSLDLFAFIHFQSLSILLRFGDLWMIRPCCWDGRPNFWSQFPCVFTYCLG